MPIISQFMYCGQATGDANGLIRIEDPLSLLAPGKLPGKYSFTIVFTILGMPEDVIKHTLRVQFMDPNEKILLDTNDLDLENDPNAGDLPPKMQSVLASFDFKNITLEVEGIYKTVVTFNKDVAGEFFIPAKGSDEE